MEEEKFEWLTDVARAARIIAILLAALAGAIVERDVGVLPGDRVPVSSVSSSKLSVDRAECPPPQ